MSHIEEQLWTSFTEFATKFIEEKDEVVLSPTIDDTDEPSFTDETAEDTLSRNRTEDDDVDEDLGIDHFFACQDCRTFTLVHESGQYVCMTCGLMQHKTLCEEAEYRCYADSRGANPERVGMPANPYMTSSSLGTTINSRGYDSSGIKRLAQYNSWHQLSYRDRCFYKICCRITTVAKQHCIPQVVIERAKEFYNIVKDVSILRGDNRDGLIASSLFFACKDENVPRSTKEISSMFEIKLQDLNRGIKQFRSMWVLAKKQSGEKMKQESSNPLDYIDRFCSSLPVPMEIRYIAEFIAVKAIFKNIVDDNTAPAIAAGSIFLATQVTNVGIQKEQVATACHMSSVTLSKTLKKLNERRIELLPKSIIQKFNIKARKDPAATTA